MHAEHAIRDLVTTWFEASTRGDLPTVLNLMAEDVVFLTPGQSPMFGREAFAAASRGMTDSGMKIEGQCEIQEIHVAGDFAYCWNHLTLIVTPPSGESVRRSGPALSIMRLDSDGHWSSSATQTWSLRNDCTCPRYSEGRRILRT